MKPSYIQWGHDRFNQDFKCRHVETMKCIVLTDDRMCRACYEEDMQRQGYSRPYMYGRFYNESKMPNVLHMVESTGKTLCGRHGRFLSYMVDLDGPVCLACLDVNQGYKKPLRTKGTKHPHIPQGQDVPRGTSIQA